MVTLLNDSESKNKPLNNFAKANYDVISSELDIDWDSLLECCVDEGVILFGFTIDKNVPDCKARSDTYPI